MARKQIPIKRKQQGVVTLRTMLLVLTGSLLVTLLVAVFITSYGYFRDYVSDQLAGHARDGATAIGLSLSNAIDGRDPVASASLIDAVFDSGRYLSVSYLNHQNEQIAGRAMTLNEVAVPSWFRSFADLPLPVAEAEVVLGWSRLGTVQVISHPGRAYEDLWRITIGLTASTAIIGGIGLFAVFLLLRRTLRPLLALEDQAKALGQRDFRKRVSFKSTREINQVTDAMNQMADDLGQLFEGQAKLIQHLRRVNNEDSVTGLASRSAFDQRLKVEVESEEKAAPGILILIQLADFSGYNQAYGRSEADKLLLRVATVVADFVMEHAGAFAGRRTGAEFAVFLPGVLPPDAGVWCRQLVNDLDGVYADLASPMDTAVHAGLARTLEGRGARDLMAAADEALRAAQSSNETGCHLADPDKDGHHNMETWRVIISQAIRQQTLSLWLQPMINEGRLMPVYHQVFSRIDSAEGALKAGTFVPMAERFGLISDIDRLLVQRVLDRLKDLPDQPLAVSLGNASVASETFRTDLLEQLQQAGSLARNLWIGISEQAIHHHRTAVGLLVRALGRLGVPVLVDRFGVGGVPFSYLRNLRFQGLRIDNSFIHDIDTHEDNRFYIESVVAIAHSRGVKVFATGVETAAEYSVLCKLGIDGAMGYHLGRPFAADNQQTGIKSHMPGKIRQYFKDKKDDVQDYAGGSGVIGKLILALVVVYLLVALVLGMIWSSEPETYSVREHTRSVANSMEREPITGFATTVTMIRIAETLLDKPGGYISNDIFPPGLWLDNMPNWEYGVLVQLRDLSRAMRKDISRSQSQSAEDRDLTIAEPQFHFDSESWAIPSTEAEYRRGITALKRYLDRLSSPDQADAQFFARADNLSNWLADLETRLGSLSRTLGESVGKASVSDSVITMNSGDPLAEEATGEDVKTPWTKIDDVFYEARGSSWALLHIFRAIEVDFRKVLQDKNAMASVRQVIIELEGAQGEMWSPVILNGSGFGVLANHSLTMAAYLSRANSAISDMRDLLSRG